MMMQDNSLQTGTVLITGGAGYIGSNLAHRLDSAGKKVVVVDNLSSGSLDNLPQNVIFVNGDICNEELLRKTFKENSIEMVYHFAAKKSVSESTENPQLYMRENVDNTSLLLQIMNEFSCTKIVFASTAAVYGDRDVTDLGYKEKDIPLPTNPYGLSKLLAEQSLVECTKYSNIRVVVFRFFNVGMSESLVIQDSGEDLLSVLTQCILSRRTFEIFGSDYNTPDGTCYRDYIHMSDLLDALEMSVKFLENSSERFLILNLGSGQGISLNQIALLGSQILGQKFRYANTKRRKGDIAYSLANISLAKSELGWSPKIIPQDLFTLFFEKLERSQS